jgi:pimeloyl-ACP methyl ester carboxylesterase
MAPIYLLTDTMSIDALSIRGYHAVTTRRRESRVAELGVIGGKREVRLGPDVIRYREVGSGPTLVFVHGILANGVLWRDVVAALSERFRCVVPDLPLGGHAVPMGSQRDLSPRGVARLVADFMAALDLRDVTLVGNDTGGAICQIVIAEHPERIGRLVLTNCDAYEAFFPWQFNLFAHHGPRLFGPRYVDLVARMLRARLTQRLLLKAVAKRRMDEATLDAYFANLIGDAGVRRDLARFLRQVSRRYTLEAAERFPDFRRPVLIVWGTDDIFFLARYARRLQEDFPDARLRFLAGSRAFVPEDRPEALAGHVADFVQQRSRAGLA